MSNIERLIPGSQQMPADIPGPVHVGPMLSGVQAIWRFPNGRGASVINHRGSYGTELAVLRFKSESVTDFDLDYSTPVTNDVIGRIADTEELADLLRQIMALPAPGTEGVGMPGGDPFDAIESLGRML